MENIPVQITDDVIHHIAKSIEKKLFPVSIKIKKSDGSKLLLPFTDHKAKKLHDGKKITLSITKKYLKGLNHEHHGGFLGALLEAVPTILNVLGGLFGIGHSVAGMVNEAKQASGHGVCGCHGKGMFLGPEDYNRFISNRLMPAHPMETGSGMKEVSGAYIIKNADQSMVPSTPPMYQYGNLPYEKKKASGKGMFL